MKTFNSIVAFALLFTIVSGSPFKADWIELDNFLDQNLDLFRRHSNDGYYMEIQSSLFSTPQLTGDVDYDNVRLQSSTGFARNGSAGESVEEDKLKFSAGFLVDKLTYQIGRFNSTTKMGPNNEIINAVVHVYAMGLNLEALLDDSNPSACYLTTNFSLKLGGKVILQSPYEFYDGMDITKFFQESFVDRLNTSLAQRFNGNMLPHECNPVQIPKTIFAMLLKNTTDGKKYSN